MEAKVSEVLENILGLLALEGSFEVVEGEEEVMVTIDPNDPGRLIGFRGETLDSLQLLVNQIISRQNAGEFKRVVIDVANWRKNKEADLEIKTKAWADEVVESQQELALEPMPSWQRRVIHMIISEIEGLESESLGEGKDRHLVIRPVAKAAKAKPKSKKAVKKEVKTEEIKTTD